MISFTCTNSSCFLTDDGSRIRNRPPELHTLNANSATVFDLLEVVPGHLSVKVPGPQRSENCLEW